MKISIIIVLIVLFSTLCLVESKKKKLSDDKRPIEMKPELYCNAC